MNPLSDVLFDMGFGIKKSIFVIAALAGLTLQASLAFADGWDDLRAAIYYNREAEVARLLDEGADINMRNAEGWTPLHVAAEQGMTRMVRYLLARGADANARTDRGRTPYDVAAGYSEVQGLLKPRTATPPDPFAAYLGDRKATATAPAAPQTAAKPQTQIKPKPAVPVVKPAKDDSHCKVMWREATALCGLGATSCNTSAHIRYQSCLKKGTWY